MKSIDRTVGSVGARVAALGAAVYLLAQTACTYVINPTPSPEQPAAKRDTVWMMSANYGNQARIGQEQGAGLRIEGNYNQVWFAPEQTNQAAQLQGIVTVPLCPAKPDSCVKSKKNPGDDREYLPPIQQ